MTDSHREKLPWIVLHAAAGILIAMVAYWSTRIEGRVDELENARVDGVRSGAVVETEMRQLTARAVEIRDEVKSLGARFGQFEQVLTQLRVRFEQREDSSSPR